MISERPSTGLERPLPADLPAQGHTQVPSRSDWHTNRPTAHAGGPITGRAAPLRGGLRLFRLPLAAFCPSLVALSDQQPAVRPVVRPGPLPPLPPALPGWPGTLSSVPRRSQSHHDPGHLNPPRNLSRPRIGDAPAYGKHQMRRGRVTAAAGPAIPRALHCRWPGQGRLALDIPYRGIAQRRRPNKRLAGRPYEMADRVVRAITRRAERGWRSLCVDPTEDEGQSSRRRRYRTKQAAVARLCVFLYILQPPANLA